MPLDGVGSSGHTNLVCPACSASQELVIENEKITLGYSYAAGSSHFEPTREVKLKGLLVVPGEPDDLDVQLAERHWHFSVSRLSHLRFAVLPAAWARGRRLGDLDFRSMNVTVEAAERDRVKASPDMERVLEAGDFLWLAGPDPALTWAWFYMNHGPQ